MQASTIVLNEDFETPLVSGAPFYTPYVAATTFNGWTVGGVDVAIVSDNFPNTPAQSGHQWLDLMGLDQGGGNITQTIATTAGQQYNVSFWVGNVHGRIQVGRKSGVDGNEQHQPEPGTKLAAIHDVVHRQRPVDGGRHLQRRCPS
jgi:hypothetical protein